MDKFEKMIKQSVEGYEAPFNPQAWDAVSKELPDSFDYSIKDSASQYEAPYNPAAWDAVSSQLGTATAAWKWIAGAAAVIAVVAGSVYLFNTNQENTVQNANNNDSEIAITNDVDNTSEENEVISNGNNHGEYNVEHENVEENGQEIIHHIPNDLTTVIDPVEENEENGVNDNNQLSTNGSNSNSNNNESGSNGGNTTVNNGNSGNQNYNVNAGFTVSASEICANGSCDFMPELIIDDLQYVWKFGDGTIASLTNPTHKFSKAGSYVVTLTVVNPKNNKVLGTSTETVTVHPLPTPKFKWTQEYEGIPTVQFAHNSDNEKVLNWEITGLKESANKEFEYTFRKKGNYSVSLTTQNEYGCNGTSSEIIEIENDYNLLAPTAFSPDGDGKSDNFIPVALTVMDNDFTMTIYDKSGKLVYRTQNAFEPWDGRYTQDNTLAPNGTSYIWRVVLINNNGEQEMYEGQVFVIR